ncbi:MAG: DUF4233 domain-containing protein [Pseudonocardiaceae bacterium]
MSGRPGVPDPWKGLRGVFAGTLVMEAIVVALALLVVVRLGEGVSAAGAWYTGVLAVAMIVASGVQRRRWGLGLALALQVAMVLGAFAHVALGVTGLLFCGVWAYLLYLRQLVARRMAEGSLPAQRPE